MQFMEIIFTDSKDFRCFEVNEKAKFQREREEFLTLRSSFWGSKILN